VIVCIGIIPAADPLRAAGTECSNGIAVDEYGRTSLPDIWAIGDCALHPSSFAERLPIRLTRLLSDVVRDAFNGDAPPFSPADTYMPLAVYDLVGAIFAPSDPSPVSSHADKLFTRMRGVV
jgi:NAD(P)H-nitrite reductase large subunit